jgi:hypothetical protein
MPVDLTLCIEVAEHLEEKYLENFLLTICNGKVIVMTHGVPGQEGYHHVNCQPHDYWIEKVSARAYDYRAYESDILRGIAHAEGWWTHAAQGVLIFTQREDGGYEPGSRA